MWKVLIVDDEPHILSGIRNSLDWKDLGFVRVETASDYYEAVDKALEIKPEIAIFDVCIGDCFGYDIIRKLNELGLNTQYIIISGYEKFEYARQAIKCGAKRYLTKPIDRFELKETVENIIAEHLGGRAGQGESRDENLDPVLGVKYDTLSTLTNKMILTVKEDYSKNICLKTVANLFKMNSIYMGQIFLKDTKLKFSEYLMCYRMIQAKEMIQSTDHKIFYIAYHVGYHNLNYFYSHFKLYFNFSPSELRSGEKEGGVS